MLKRILAFGLLALAVSPFTAPFQTYVTVADSSDTCVLVAPLFDDSGAGGLIAPLSTRRGRLTITPPSVFAVSAFVLMDLVTLFFEQPTSRAHSPHHLSIVPAVLRR